MPQFYRRLLLRYGSAVVAVALMTGLRAVIAPLTGQRQPFIAFYFAVLFTAWYGGFGPSIAAIVLSCLSAVYFFFAPYDSFYVRDPGDLVAVAMFVAVSMAIVAFSEANRAAHRLLEREVSERKDAERAAKDSEERLQQLFHTMPQIVWISDARGAVLHFNGRWHEYTGLSVDESLSHDGWRSAVHPDDLNVFDKVRLSALRRGGMFETEARLRDRQGQYHWHLIRSVPVLDESGRVLRRFGTATDIHDRKLAERERQKFVSLAQNSGEFIGMCDMQGIPSFVNDAGMRMVGLDGLEQAVRTPVREFFFPADQEFITGTFFPKVLEEGHGEVEIRFRHFKTGKALWMIYNVFVLHDADAQPAGFATVSRDITERKRAEHGLLEADRRKDEFLAMLAHELRNPLAPIYNAIAIMAVTEDDPETQRWSRELIDRQVRHLAKLVDDLLDVSRITEGKITLTRSPLAVSTFLNDAVESCQALIEARKHRLEVSLSKELLQVEGDPTRLTQIVVNLLNNAAKFTPEGGQISLSCYREGHEAVIQVRDDGEGISRDMLEKIFDLFTQANQSMDRSQGGLGVGLTLVRRLVELHGGTIEAQSDGPGKGSTFLVRLPLVPVHDAVPDLDDPTDAATARAARSRRILIVDDNQDSLDTLSRLLTQLGHEIETACDGLSACETAVTFTPSLVLLDIGLPGMDGFEVARRLRSEPSLDGMYLVALTGYGSESDRTRTGDLGFDDHLIKPVALETLKTIVEKTRAGSLR